jgi:hypothetical protein
VLGDGVDETLHRRRWPPSSMPMREVIDDHDPSHRCRYGRSPTPMTTGIDADMESRIDERVVRGQLQ